MRQDQLWLAFLRLGRPQFLVGGLAFNALGLALALAHDGMMTLGVFLLIQVVVSATQIGVHFGNEWHDLAADRANANRTLLAGGSRVLVEGKLAPQIAQRASRAAFAIAALFAIVLQSFVTASGWHRTALTVTELGVIGLAWAYSAPPLRLHSRGLGELAAGLVIAAGVPLLGILAAGATWTPHLWVLAPLVLQVTALVIVLSMPDAAGDQAAGKRTLAVRLQGRRTRRLVQMLWLSCGLATVASILWGAPLVAALGGGAAFSAAVALPILVLRRRWDALGLTALAIVALQWVIVMTWALQGP